MYNKYIIGICMCYFLEWYHLFLLFSNTILAHLCWALPCDNYNKHYFCCCCYYYHYYYYYITTTLVYSWWHLIISSTSHCYQLPCFTVYSVQFSHTQQNTDVSSLIASYHLLQSLIYWLFFWQLHLVTGFPTLLCDTRKADKNKLLIMCNLSS